MNKIYRLITYEYDTYSYSGISESENYFSRSKETLLAKAKELRLTVTDYPSEANKHAMLEEVELI